MNIAIIGTGSVGSALAAGFVKAGHQVYLSARTSEHVETAAQETGAVATTSPTAAAALAEIIVLAVPFGAVEDIAAAIAPVVNGKTVVDVTNPAKEDWSGPLFSGNDSGAEHLAAWLPTAHVVKAFNTVLAGNLNLPAPDAATLDGYVAGDDAAAKASVLELAAAVGLHPIDVGLLSAARLLEPLAWLNISLNMQPGWTWKTGWKLIGAPESTNVLDVAA